MFKSGKSGINDANSYLADDAQLDKVALMSQRAVKTYKHEDKEKFCRVIPAKPDGNCGFTATRRYLTLIGEHDVAQNLFREKFIQLVQQQSKSSDHEIQTLILDIIKNDRAIALDDWCIKFTGTGYWLFDVHFKLLSRIYNIEFRFYSLDSDHHYFIPEIGNESIYSNQDSEHKNVVNLAHVSTQLRDDNAPLNHYEGLRLQPLPLEEKQIDLWLDEVGGFKQITTRHEFVRVKEEKAMNVEEKGVHQTIGSGNVISGNFAYDNYWEGIRVKGYSAEEVVKLMTGLEKAGILENLRKMGNVQDSEKEAQLIGQNNQILGTVTIHKKLSNIVIKLKPPKYDPRLLTGRDSDNSFETCENKMEFVIEVISKHITQKQEDVFQCSVDEDFDEQKLYIPLLANPFGSISTGEDLKMIVKNFVDDESKKVFLISGTMGSGKSMFMYDYTTSQFVRNIIPNKGNYKGYILIYITLPIWKKSQKSISDYIAERYKFNQGQMEYLKKSCKILFVLDGYDELHGYDNIIQENHLITYYKDAKVIITCRDTWLSRYSKDLKDLFSPGISVHNQEKDLSKIFHYNILPFTPNDVKLYIENFLTVCKEHDKSYVGIQGTQWELPKTYLGYIYGSHEDRIEKIPGLEDIVRTPFLLRIVMLTIKTLVEKYMRRKSDETLSYDQKKIKFYDVIKGFVEHIYRRQVHKLTETDILPKLSDGDDITDLMESFSQDLAADIWKYLIAVPNPSSVIRYIRGDKGSVWHKYLGMGKGTWGFKENFKKNEESLKKVRDGCPLKAFEGGTMFLHDTLLDYYLHTRSFDREEYLSKKALENIAKNVLPEHERNKPAERSKAEEAYDAFAGM